MAWDIKDGSALQFCVINLEKPLATAQFKSYSQGRVKEPYSLRDKRLPQSICRAGQGQQPVTEGAPLPRNGLVQRVVDIVQDGQGGSFSQLQMSECPVQHQLLIQPSSPVCPTAWHPSS